MPRLRWLLIAGLAAVLAVVLAGAVVAPRIRARLRADWFERPNLTLAPAVKNLKEPTFLASVPNAKDRFFVLERAGLVRLVANGQVQSQPVLDLRQEVSSVGNEQGLFGLAFHPDFAHTGYVYVDYSGLDNSVEVVRYHVSAANPDQLDPASAQVVL